MRLSLKMPPGGRNNSMRIVMDEKMVSRNQKIARYTMIASLAILVIGLIISFTNPEQIIISFGALLLGFLMSQIALFYGNRWGKSPRPDEILNDEVLKSLPANQRKPRLLERQKLMRHFSRSKAYLERGEAGQPLFIKGSVFYPSPETMKANIQGYRKVVLDQSFNLGKDIFGNLADHVPFTFRSDGTVRDEHGKTIPTGEVIYSRPYDKKGVGTTPTGISRGDAVDHEGNMVKTFTEDDVASGRFFFTGTLNLLYDPILSGKTVEP